MSPSRRLFISLLHVCKRSIGLLLSDRHRLPFVRVVEWLDGHELDPELLTTLDEPDELGLIDHGAGQNRRSVLPLQRHPSEAFLELIAEFASQDDPIAVTRRLFHGLEPTLALRWVSPHHLRV